MRILPASPENLPRIISRWRLIVGVTLGLLVGPLATPAWSQTLQTSLPRLTKNEPLPTRSDFQVPETLLGDWGGLRTRLDQYGVSFTLNQTSDYVGNTQGGIRQGFVYDGLLDLEIDFDLNKALGWEGAMVHFTGYGVQGQNLSSQFVGNIFTTTNVESTPSIAKLGELWFNQQLFDDRLGARIGLLEADRYFFISPTANVFVNSTFGFPDGWQVDMPMGGPGYPSVTAGALGTYDFNDDWKVTASVMNGAPLAPITNGSQYGTKLPWGSGVLSWLEVSFSPELQTGDKVFPGYYKMGGWYNSDNIQNVTLTNSGRTFDNPVNTSYHGQYSVYGLFDQAIWRENSSDTQGLNVFTRVTYNPQNDRNLVTWYFDAGLAYLGLFDGRPQDVLGLGFAYAKFSPYLNSQIAAQNTLANTQTPMVSPEMLVELTYQMPLSPWLTLQPFFQYSINPGGSAPMPNNPNQAIPNATIVGLRGNIAF